MRYHSFSSEREKEYVVEPGASFAQGALYLIAFVPEHSETRTFAVDRIKSLSLTEERFEPVDGVTTCSRIRSACITGLRAGGDRIRSADRATCGSGSARFADGARRAGRAGGGDAERVERLRAAQLDPQLRRAGASSPLALAEAIQQEAARMGERYSAVTRPATTPLF